MDPDLFFVIGCVALALAALAAVSAFSGNRTVSSVIFLFLTGAATIGYAIWAKPSGYSVGTVPEVFQTVFARYL